MAQVSFRMQDIVIVDLLAQVRGGVKQVPVLTVGADGDGRLGPLWGSRVILPGSPAIGVVTIPLRITAARGCSQYPDVHFANSY